MVTGRWEYYIRQVLLAPIVSSLYPVLRAAAFIWRRLLFRTTVIAVTGSVGKTTTKECIASILASRARTFRSYRNQNGTKFVILNLLRIRPWHRFAVLEVAVGRPGDMKRSARLLRPDVVIVLNVLRTHTTAFRSLEEHAIEKRLLIEATKSSGVAVLNGDDSRVRTMAASSPCKVVFFGTTDGCDYKASRISAEWPKRLSFELLNHSLIQKVQTRLVGAHWLGSSLAALAAANTLGVNLPAGAETLRHVDPFPGRLQPVRLPGGAVVLRDDYNASIDTMESSLKVLKEAKASRRVLVITDFSDFPGNRKNRLRYLAGRAHHSTDVFVLAGKDADYGRRRAIDAGMPAENVYAFDSIRAAAEFLKAEIRPGDLVLIKGRTTDHAARIFLAQLGKVGCWMEYCPKRMLCDICWELDVTPAQLALARIVDPDGNLRPGQTFTVL